MASGFGQMRRFEAEYYAGMPSDVSELAQLRNIGKDSIAKSGNVARRIVEGLCQLRESAEGLGEVAVGPYSRERYASLYMLARGLCVAGNIRAATEVAIEAMGAEPQIPDGMGLPSELVADQYVAIASAPLSAVLQAGIDQVEPIALLTTRDARLAEQAASRALQTCVWSENRTRMLFADGAMSNEQRAKARLNHVQKAAKVTGMLLVPGQSNRIAIARRLCKM